MGIIDNLSDIFSKIQEWVIIGMLWFVTTARDFLLDIGITNNVIAATFIPVFIVFVVFLIFIAIIFRNLKLSDHGPAGVDSSDD